MKERHILIANVFFAPNSYGGATVVAEEVAQALKQIGGFRITAVSLCMRNDLAPYVVIKTQMNGITNYLINVPSQRSYGEMYDNQAITVRIAELLAALTPDLVHVHCVQDMGTGIIGAAEALHIPVVLSVHDFWWICDRQFMIRVDQRYCAQDPVRIDACKGCADSFWAAKVRHRHLREMASKAALVTYPSKFAKQLSENSGFAPGAGVVWQNGVRLPEASFFERQAARRQKDSRVTFGFVGGPSQIKGWPQIRDAFEAMGRDDFRVMLVDGSLDAPWWSKTSFEKYPGEWVVHPRFSQDTMDDFYVEIDVLLFMSQWKETFGLAIREALARGVKVIQTDSGGTMEHDAIDVDKLIPIGAPSHVLRTQLEEAVAATCRETQLHKVTSFEDQAQQFIRLIEPIMSELERSA